MVSQRSVEMFGNIKDDINKLYIKIINKRKFLKYQFSTKHRKKMYP